MHRLGPTLVLAITALTLSPLASAQTQAQPAKRTADGRVSPHETVSKVIGDRRTGCRVTITYGRPFSADPKTGEVRKIWGGLVPWDRPWRLGADEATLLLTQQPLAFGETTIPAGAYTLYLVPSESGTSQLVFSSNLGKWGVPVDETHDVARVPLTRSGLEKSLDQLTIAIESDPAPAGDVATSGAIKISWETTRFSVPFTVRK
jgi:hypothetical protein